MPGKNKHFTYDKRVFIQQNLNKLSFKDMGRKLEKRTARQSRWRSGGIQSHVHKGTWGKEYNSCAKRDRCPASGLCRMKPCARKTCRGPWERSYGDKYSTQGLSGTDVWTVGDT